MDKLQERLTKQLQEVEDDVDNLRTRGFAKAQQSLDSDQLSSSVTSFSDTIKNIPIDDINNAVEEIVSFIREYQNKDIDLSIGSWRGTGRLLASCIIDVNGIEDSVKEVFEAVTESASTMENAVGQAKEMLQDIKDIVEQVAIDTFNQFKQALQKGEQTIEDVIAEAEKTKKEFLDETLNHEDVEQFQNMVKSITESISTFRDILGSIPFDGVKNMLSKIREIITKFAQDVIQSVLKSVKHTVDTLLESAERLQHIVADAHTGCLSCILSVSHPELNDVIDRMKTLSDLVDMDTIKNTMESLTQLFEDGIFSSVDKVQEMEEHVEGAATDVKEMFDILDGKCEELDSVFNNATELFQDAEEMVDKGEEMAEKAMDEVKEAAEDAEELGDKLKNVFHL